MTVDLASNLDVLELKKAHIYLRSAKAVFSPSGGFSALAATAEHPVLECVTSKCRAVISLQGAQLLSFIPTGKQELLWLSPLATFKPGDAIRGGIPLCLPWFGLNRRQPELPKHGVARTQFWALDDVSQDDDETLNLRLVFNPSSDDLEMFPYPFSAQLNVSMGDALRLSLVIKNEGAYAMPLSFAMHSYFAVSDVRAVKIEGVEGREYLDNCRDLARFVQDESLQFDGEIDRVYETVGGCQAIIDGSRQIKIDGSACDTVVIWNPGETLAGTMADVGSYYRDYVCLERGMAFGDELELAAGDVARATMQLSPN
ncbi:D-hexose-6-phosphate mutarotase [Zhongshania aliphaticivorans]|uniref:D-hexose-6-phosphate mutarotase n=1 Tax=Zhongshania aliphaticivorans TaxID=1470434 RepID=UPI0012E6DBEC|nr:D-hexose-6-phosphate mutarotase [Zhongshania aliphaticivorans]CAA0115091.1 Putative glucose-6-phosphate 1-epimerase [Zhongshania aliphaticivorans]